MIDDRKKFGSRVLDLLAKYNVIGNHQISSILTLARIIKSDRSKLIDQRYSILIEPSIWGLCNRKGGNSREKSNLLLCADLALTRFLFFPVVSSLSIAKAEH